MNGQVASSVLDRLQRLEERLGGQDNNIQVTIFVDFSTFARQGRDFYRNSKG